MDFTEHSYWLTTRPYAPSPAVSSDQTADVAIVGGGYTGLSTAYHLKKLDPTLKVVLLEGEMVGFGASGRNGGFAMTLFGLTMQLTKLRFGREQVLQAHHYMEQAVDYVGKLVAEYNLDCEYERPGFLRAATSEKYAKRIRNEMKLAHSLGIEGVEWIDEQAVRKEVDSPLYLGAWWEPRCALVNPAQLAWEMKRICEELMVEMYENSPVAEISRAGDGFTLKVGEHEISVGKLALATNAYSDAFPQLRRKQIPVFTRIVLTEPLGDQLKRIGWANRQGIEDARNLISWGAEMWACRTVMKWSWIGTKSTLSSWRTTYGTCFPRCRTSSLLTVGAGRFR
jgi:glycine/D-amino acid oxidase-like deaminating enzyme